MRFGALVAMVTWWLVEPLSQCLLLALLFVAMCRKNAARDGHMTHSLLCPSQGYSPIDTPERIQHVLIVGDGPNALSENTRIIGNQHLGHALRNPLIDMTSARS